MKLAPCRCGHPGLGCDCYDIRLAELLAAEKVAEKITATFLTPTKDVLRQLRALPEVDSAEVQWFHGHVQIRVTLRDWTYHAMETPSGLIDTFAREHVSSFGVTTRFDPPTLMPPEAT